MTKYEDVIDKEYDKQHFLDKKVSYKCKDFTLDESTQQIALRKPYFEFHGACAGCGETAYIN